MANSSKVFDVFIAHSEHDAALAMELAAACRASGLEAVSHGELVLGGDVSDALREALAESQAFLVILSPSGLTPSMGIEIGGAQAWNKPIFGVVTDPALTQLPAGLSGTKLYPPGRIGDVIHAIKRSGQPLSDDDRSVLAIEFRRIGVSVDQLALEPKHLQGLVKRFNTRAHKNVSGERLLSELLRMRKQGLLKNNRLRRAPKPRSSPA